MANRTDLPQTNGLLSARSAQSIRDLLIAAARDQNVQLVLGLAVVSAVAHFANIFHAPYYEADEGTYLSQAWAVARTGQLSPYYFIYDHVPAGWMLIGFWGMLVGGFAAFGTSVDTGRVLMGLLHVASTGLVAMLALKLGRSQIGAAAAGLFYALSPVGIYFHRRVLLDNVMIFWLLLGVLFVVLCLERRRLLHAALGGLMFGLAALSKEPAVIFLPVAFMALVLSGRPWRRNLTPAGVFSLVALLTVVPYFLYAFQRNELFPNGGVSLIGAMLWQWERGATDSAFSISGGFRQALDGWMYRDSLTLYLAAAAVIVTPVLIVLGGLARRAVLPALFAASYVLFLVERRDVLELYIIPLLPFLALAIGVAAAGAMAVIRSRFESLAAYANLALAVLLLGASAGMLVNGQFNFRANQTGSQRQATEWIRTNVPSSSFVVIDAYNWVDLHDPSFGKTIPGAHYYWKVVDDPSIRDGWLDGDWRRIDYMAVTPQMAGDIRGGNLPILTDAYKNSQLVQSFSGVGWGVEVRKVVKRDTSGEWGFEDGINDEWRIHVSPPEVQPPEHLQVTTNQAHSGTRSLELGALLTGDNKNAVVQKTNRLADELTVWVYLPPSVSGEVWALPFVFDSQWQWRNGPGVSLVPGQWTKLSWKLDAADISFPLQTAGFMFGSPAGYEGPIYLDDIVLLSEKG